MLAVTSTRTCYSRSKMLPSLRHVFEDVTGDGRYWPAGRVIEIKDPVTGKFWARRADDRMYARIILRSADTGGGLESSTAKAAWLDEAGMGLRFTARRGGPSCARLSTVVDAQGRGPSLSTLFVRISRVDQSCRGSMTDGSGGRRTTRSSISIRRRTRRSPGRSGSGRGRRCRVGGSRCSIGGGSSGRSGSFTIRTTTITPPPATSYSGRSRRSPGPGSSAWTSAA